MSYTELFTSTLVYLSCASVRYRSAQLCDGRWGTRRANITFEIYSAREQQNGVVWQPAWGVGVSDPASHTFSLLLSSNAMAVDYKWVWPAFSSQVLTSGTHMWDLSEIADTILLVDGDAE